MAAEAGLGETVAVVGDGAVGLLAVLAAKQLGAERVIAQAAAGYQAMDQPEASKVLMRP